MVLPDQVLSLTATLAHFNNVGIATLNVGTSFPKPSTLLVRTALSPGKISVAPQRPLGFRLLHMPVLHLCQLHLCPAAVGAWAGTSAGRQADGTVSQLCSHVQGALMGSHALQAACLWSPD